VHRGEDVHGDLQALAKFPQNVATSYQSMYAYGFYLRTRSAELHLKSMNSGVVATFQRPYRNGRRDRNFVMASLEYVGNVDEILELVYGTVCMVVFICTWGPFATIEAPLRLSRKIDGDLVWQILSLKFSRGMSYLHSPFTWSKYFIPVALTCLAGRL
jgi:hypothetical protein